MLCLVVAFVALAAPASALQEEDADLAPAPDVSQEADRVAEEPAPAIVEPGGGAEFIAPPPDDFTTEPTIAPPPPAPKIDSAQFGVGWPAAAAVGIALVAVLAMALMWKRDELVN